MGDANVFTFIKQDIIKLVNKCHDDFEKQTCENCCELQPEFNNTCAIGVSIPEDFDGFINLLFGCNNFCNKQEDKND